LEEQLHIKRGVKMRESSINRLKLAFNLLLFRKVLSIEQLGSKAIGEALKHQDMLADCFVHGNHLPNLRHLIAERACMYPVGTN
jgi:hypothetical protein